MMKSYKKAVNNQHAPLELIEKTKELIRKKEAGERVKTKVNGFNVIKPVVAVVTVIIVVFVGVFVWGNTEYARIPYMQTNYLINEQNPNNSLAFGPLDILKTTISREEFFEFANKQPVTDLFDYALINESYEASLNENMEIKKVGADFTYKNTQENSIDFSVIVENNSSKNFEGNSYFINGNEIYFMQYADNTLQAMFEEQDKNYLIFSNNADKKTFLEFIKNFSK